MQATRLLCTLSLGLLLISSSVATAAPGIDPKAVAIVNSMSDKLKTSKTLKATGTRQLDPELVDGSPVKESVNFELTVVRPGKVLVRTSDSAGSRRVIANGKRLTLTDDAQNLYATVDAKFKTVDDVISAIHTKMGFRPVLAEFLGSDPAGTLLEGVTAGSIKGEAMVAGTKCTRLAFTQPDVKWELWVDAENLPRKIVVTYFRIKGSPQASATINSWDLGSKVPRRTFAYKPTKDAQKIEIIPVPFN